jgi:ribosomal protein S18 acetylase RimI-like enzyme
MPTIRTATPHDLDPLMRIEERSFATDRLSRRAFRYLLTKANAATLVETGEAGDDDGGLRGYAMVLFHRGISMARLYSLAVDPAFRRLGIGQALLARAERAALEREAAYMRLEVRADDRTAGAMYRAHGYRPFGRHKGYYEDGADALVLEKSLAPPPDPTLIRVPYYAQSLDFTCGPAAVLMAMRAIDDRVTADRTAELRLWREATTIFMTSGLGGCSPEGLALAVRRRGFSVALYLSDRQPMFVDSVRDLRKREVIRLVQDDFRGQIAACGIPLKFQPLTLELLRARFDAGGVPVVLTSSYRFDRARQPHWVVVTGFDRRYIYLHDPNVDVDLDRTPTDCMQIPVPQADFIKMARYGRAHRQAALIIGRNVA